MFERIKAPDPAPALPGTHRFSVIGFLRAGLIAAPVLGLAAGEAQACRCTRPSPAAAFKAADGVVFGRIAAVTPRGDGALDFTVAVERSWKRAPAGEIGVIGSPACVFEPALNTNYVIYLHAGPHGRLETDSCMGNVAEPEAGATLQFLAGHQ